MRGNKKTEQLQMKNMHTLHRYTQNITLNKREPQFPRLQVAATKYSPNAHDMFCPIPGLINCAKVTGSVSIYRITCHARATQMTGVRST